LAILIALISTRDACPICRRTLLSLPDLIRNILGKDIPVNFVIQQWEGDFYQKEWMIPPLPSEDDIIRVTKRAYIEGHEGH
jgi:hypothetical protein